MAAAADELHNDFETATSAVIEALEDTQRAKGSEEERNKAREEERQAFEIQKQKAVMLQKQATEAEEQAKVLYYEAQKKEDKGMETQDAFLHTIAGALAGIPGTAVLAAVQTIASIVDKLGQKEAMRMANEQKKKQIEEMQKQRDLRHEALLQCMEFAEKIKNCQDDSALAEAAIEALHSSIGALKSLSAIMMNAAMFWQQMQVHCESLATEKMQKQVEGAMKMDEGKRLKIWTSCLQGKGRAILFRVGCSG